MLRARIGSGAGNSQPAQGRSSVGSAVCWRGVRSALGLLTLVAAGCQDPRRTTSDEPADGEELPILAQLQEAHSHELQPMQVVIRDAGAYARIPLREMEVDFSREMLLVVTLGRRLSDQYGVRIERVWREGRELQVETRITRPPPGAPPVFASPYCVAKVPRCDLNVAGFDPEPPARARTWGQSQYGLETTPPSAPP